MKHEPRFARTSKYFEKPSPAQEPQAAHNCCGGMTVAEAKAAVDALARRVAENGRALAALAAQYRAAGIRVPTTPTTPARQFVSTNGQLIEGSTTAAPQRYVTPEGKLIELM